MQRPANKGRGAVSNIGTSKGQLTKRRPVKKCRGIVFEAKPSGCLLEKAEGQLLRLNQA